MGQICQAGDDDLGDMESRKVGEWWSGKSGKGYMKSGKGDMNAGKGDMKAGRGDIKPGFIRVMQMLRGRRSLEKTLYGVNHSPKMGELSGRAAATNKSPKYFLNE